MVTTEQLKVVEYLATGHSIPQAAKEVGVAADTVRGWLKNNPDVVSELSSATDIFQKECLKSRSRAYRQMAKGISDKILEKMADNALDNYNVDELVKMLNNVIKTSKDDESTGKTMLGIGNQTNIQINANVQGKLNDTDFARKFGELLQGFDPDDIQNVVEAKEKADRQNEYYQNK
jgi:predicted transcriptional regulator